MALRTRWVLPVAAALMLSACSAGATDDPAADASPSPGGSVKYAVSSPFGSFDPNVTASAPDARVVRQVYDSLVELDDDGTIKPWLASAWTTSADGTTYTFTLRDGVKFHDGTAFDAAAVCHNFDRIVAPATKSLYAISLIGPYKSCTATDAKTATVTLSAPYTPFLANLSTPFLGMASPKATDLGTKPVGTGPFKFVSYRANSDITLERNPDYNWAPETAKHQGPAYLDKLTFQIIADATVRIGSLRNGDVQGMGDVPPQQVAAVKQDSTLKYEARPQAGAVFQLFFNTKRPGLDDPAVRRALVKAMDLDAAVKATYFGAYERAATPLSPTSIGYDEAVKNGLPYGKDAAAADLTAAGWVPGPDGIRVKGGQKLVLKYLGPSPNYDNRQELADFLVQNLKDVGVGVDMMLQPGAQGVQTVIAGTYDIATTSFVAVDPDILNTIYGSASIFDLAKTSDFDADLKRAQALPAGADRDKLYADVQTAAIRDAYSVPVYVGVYTVATATALRGLGYDAAAYPEFYDAFLAK